MIKLLQQLKNKLLKRKNTKQLEEQAASLRPKEPYIFPWHYEDN